MLSRMAGFTSRYANALFDLADEAGAVDAVARDLTALDALIADNDDLRRLVVSPAIGRDAQTRAIKAVLEAAKAAPLTIQFVCTVAANGRLFALRSMIKRFLDDLAYRRGEVSAECVSAIPLDESLTGEIRKIIAGIAGSEKIALETRVDESLIGGLVVRVGSRMIDSSIRTKLNRLELSMKGAS